MQQAPQPMETVVPTVALPRRQAGRAQAQTLREARVGEREEVFGSSTALEKEYLRLTALPTVDAVRPPEVLQQVRRGPRHWLGAESCAWM